MLRQSSARILRCANCFRNASFLEGENIRQHQIIASVFLHDHPKTRAVQPTSYGRPPPPARYGGRNNVTLIPGDGVGPELTRAVKTVFDHAGVPVDFEELHISGMDEEVFQDNVDDVITSVKRNSVALKGNIHTPIDIVGFRSLNVELRTKLDLFANVVRCKSISGLTTRHKNVDLVIIRENTEGEYSQLEHENVSGVVESLKIITEEKSLRIARYAFEYAMEHNRKKVTAIHKANIMKLADGLFLKCCKEVSKEFPNIEFESMIIDNTAMQLVSKPQQFDVMVMPNLYGNIITNIGAALVGGPGLIPGENVGDNYAVFETGTRNTGKGLVGKNISNPVSMLFASTLLLEHLGLHYHCEAISNAVLKVLAEGQVRTPDLGGTSTTSDMIDAITAELDRGYSYSML